MLEFNKVFEVPKVLSNIFIHFYLLFYDEGSSIAMPYNHNFSGYLSTK